MPFSILSIEGIGDNEILCKDDIEDEVEQFVDNEAIVLLLCWRDQILAYKVGQRYGEYVDDASACES